MGAGAGGVNISTPREKGIAFPLRHHICGSPFSLFFFFLISLISYLLSSSGPIFLSFLGSFCLFLVGWLAGSTRFLFGCLSIPDGPRPPVVFDHHAPEAASS